MLSSTLPLMVSLTLSSNVTNAIHADNVTRVASVINFINVASETSVVSIMKGICPTLGRCLLP